MTPEPEPPSNGKRVFLSPSVGVSLGMVGAFIGTSLSCAVTLVLLAEARYMGKDLATAQYEALSEKIDAFKVEQRREIDGLKNDIQRLADRVERKK
jgi:hypothetical protein